MSDQKEVWVAHVMADKRNTGAIQKIERDTAIRFDKQNRRSMQKIDASRQVDYMQRQYESCGQIR